MNLEELKKFFSYNPLVNKKYKNVIRINMSVIKDILILKTSDLNGLDF